MTIGAPSDAAHVSHNFGAKLDDIAKDGEAEVQLAGRTFKITKLTRGLFHQLRLTTLDTLKPMFSLTNSALLPNI